MRKVFLDKGNNKVRTVYAFNKAEKNRSYRHLITLEKMFFEAEKVVCSYGFIPGRNCVQNAACHIGIPYTVCLDVKDFFDSIDPVLATGIPAEIIKDCTVDGRFVQGLPTSPMISNIFFIPIDLKIREALSSFLASFTYSRYADDITIGIDDKSLYGKTVDTVKEILSNYSLQLNDSKTKLQDASNGRMIITGVGVDETGVYPTRKTLKKIRAAKHQGNSSSLDGLEEWAKCRLPTKGDRNG